jgi:actin-like ATPase involved in cell morphogenesis
MTTKIGIDLGYANITLSNVTADVRREASVVMVDKSSRKILSVGDDAACGFDAPDEGMLVRPFKNGLLYSSEITKEVINYFIGMVKPAEKIRCVIGIPSDFLPKQTDELIKMFSECGVDQCYAVSRAAAALIGAGYSPNINAVSVNIGAQATEIAVFYKGKIILSEREEVGGEDFDKAVKQYISDKGGVNVSLSVSNR